MSTGHDDNADDPLNVSPYLLNRLRTYEEALADRRRQRRDRPAADQPQDRPRPPRPIRTAAE